MASLVTTTINGTLTGNSSATFDSTIRSKNQLRVSNDYSVNYFYKTNNTTMLGYLLMRDDNNSFLSFPAAQDFRFLHGNTSRIAVQTDGNVGIGTANPEATLHIKEIDTDEDAIIKISPNNGSYDPVLQFTPQDGTLDNEGFEIWYDNNVGDAHIHTIYNNDAAAIRFHTRTGASKSTSNERLTIAGDGNVGIGSTDPQRTLDVSASGQITFGDQVSSGTSDNKQGIYWHNTDSYGIFRTSGSWAAPNYQQLILKWATGIILNPGGGTYGKSHVGVVGGVSIGDSYFTSEYDNGLIVQGNVGIGTTAPGYPLHVVGKIYSSTEGQFGNAIAKNNSGVATFGSNSTATTIKINLDASASRNDLVIEGSTGDVGIGTASPAEKLHIGSGASENSNLFVRVDGDAAFQKGFNIFADGSEQWRIYTTASSSDLRFYDGSNVTVTFKDGGNVGVNTTSPTSKLQVVGSTSGDSVLKIDGTNGTLFEVVDDLSDSLMSVNDAAGLPVFEVFADNHIVAGRYNQNDFYLNTSGNLGLGTSSPITKLNIKGDQSTNGQLYIEPTNDSEYAGLVIKTTRGADRAYAIFAGGTGTDDLNFRFRDASAGADRMVIDSSGKVGIGTDDPKTKLHIDTGSSIGAIDTAYSLAIRGDGIDGIQILSDSAYSGRIVFGDQNSNNAGRIYYDHSTDAFRFFTNGTEKVSILSDGNVGIGT
jgi:hypothetical protein